MKTYEQNRNNRRAEIERFDWFVERIQAQRGFWLIKRTLRWKNFVSEELSRNQSKLRFNVTLQRHWPIEQYLLHIRVFFGGKTKSPCFDLFIHWLIKQITNTYGKHFSRSYENRHNRPGNINSYKIKFGTQWLPDLLHLEPHDYQICNVNIYLHHQNAILGDKSQTSPLVKRSQQRGGIEAAVLAGYGNF